MLHEVPAWPQGVEALFCRRLSDQPLIHEGAVVYKSRLGSWTEVGRGSEILESVIDDYSYDAGGVSIVYSEIGRFCSIASHVRVNPGNHPRERVTQHHCTYRRVQFGLDGRDDEEFFAWRRGQTCRIGHDVWIGHGAVVLPGVSIGIGAVVGAGAVVSRDVAAYQVVAGVPARPVRMRFEERVVEALLASEWWSWDRRKLEESWRDLCDLELFLSKHCGL